jgi:flagellar biosynthesis GTPase FlhF
VVEMFQNTEGQSTASGEGQMKLKAYIRANRPIANSTVVNADGKGNNLNDITDYLNVHHNEFQEFVLKRIMKSDYEKLID